MTAVGFHVGGGEEALVLGKARVVGQQMSLLGELDVDLARGLPVRETQEGEELWRGRREIL